MSQPNASHGAMPQSDAGNASKDRCVEARALSHQAAAYRPEIDGLRAVAVLAVLINHMHHQWLPGGFLGVDLFFVISGYVVTASLARRKETSWRQMLAGFYTRRFRRLIPALLLMVVLTAIVFSAFVSPSDATYGQSIRTGLTSLVGAANLYLLSQDNNYFDFGTQFNPFLHTWSLGVEEQFYLIWPLFVLACGVGFQGNGKKALLVLLALTLILTLISFGLYGSLTRSGASSAAFYLMPARFWELSAGAIVFLLQSLRPARLQSSLPARLQSLLNWSWLGLILWGFVVVAEPANAFMPVFVTATAGLLAGLRSHSLMGRWLSLPPVLAIGSASYSLYLWHWPLIVGLRWTIGLHAGSILPLLAAIALATWASYGVETKFRFGDISGSGWKQPVILYPFASLLAGAFVFFLARAGGRFLYLGNPAVDPENFSVTRSIGGTPITTYRCFLEPTAPLSASQQREGCLVRSRPGRPTLFLEGDSISHAMLPLLEQLYASKNYNVSFVGRGGCPMPYFEPWAGDRQRLSRYQACRQHARLRETSVMAQIRRGDQLLLVTNTYTQGPRSEASYGAAISQLAANLRRKGAGLILFSPLPVFAERAAIQSPLSLCFPEWFRPVWAQPAECRPFSVNRDRLLQSTQPMRDLQQRLKSQHTNIHVFDPFPILCPPHQSSCSTHRGDIMLFSDGIHLTTAGARSLDPAVQTFLQQI
ncbi:MAG: acyltransferase family protein [Cyanobacteriota bacterium]|nr:acyltransferase family protein [Cyanobacteriota bacterium]